MQTKVGSTYFRLSALLPRNFLCAQSYSILKLVFGLLDRGFCVCVALFTMASHYSPDTMLWASAAAICRNNPFSEEMLGNSILEGLIRVRLIEKSAKSWRFSLATGEEGVVGQRSLKPIVQPEVQATRLSSEHGEGEDGPG